MSGRRILDTSILCHHWRAMQSKAKRIDLATVQRWARELIRLRKSSSLVTPVVIEFLAGARSGPELALFRAFLACFENLDEGRISSADWQNARDLAERVPKDGKPRKLGDCLIWALAARFRCDVDSHDEDYRRLRQNRSRE